MHPPLTANNLTPPFRNISSKNKHSMNNIRIVVADDHHLFRFGIKSFLSRYDEFEIVAETTNGNEIFKIVTTHQPDLLILDIDLEGINGVEVTEQLQQLAAPPRILALTCHRDEETVIKMVQAGARGYILKDGPLEEIVLAIKSLAGGNSYFAQEISGTIIAKLGSNSPRRRTKNSYENNSLTRRELEILEYISKEYTNKEIAGELYISPRTVETHRRNLMQKLKVKNSVGLVIYYFKKIQRQGVALNV